MAVLLCVSACGNDSSDRMDCTDATECRDGNVCVDGYCASTDEARVSASATANGANAPVFVIDAAGSTCEASMCKTLPYGTQVTFRAGEAPGFRFTGWTGSPGCTGTQADLVIPNLTASVQCVANYVRRLNASGSVSGTDSTVTATAEGPFALCQTSSCQVDAGQTVRLSVQQRTGERFLGWSGAGCGDGRGLEIAVTPTDGDITCVANFVGRIVVAARAMNVEALIDVAASSPAVVCEPESCQLDKGGSATLSAPEIPGYRFAGWSGTTRCTGTSTPLTLNDLQDSQSCLATYLRRVSARGSAAGATPPPAVTALSSDVGADCLGPACQVDVGGSVTLLASSAAGYRLSGWSGPMCETKASAALPLANIQADLACVANYVQGIAVIGAVVGAPGTVIATSTTPLAQCTDGGCVIDQGGNATLTAPTIEGYRFMAWDGDPGCESREAVVSFDQVPQSRTCYARYAARFIVRGTLSPSDGGSVRASSPTTGSLCADAQCTLDRGGEVTLEASATGNHRFSGWSGGGACTGAAPALRLPDIAGNTTCQANFQMRVTVTGVAVPEGIGGSVVARSDAGAANCLGAVCSIDEDSNVTLTATPALGYRFTGWSGCATSTDPNLTLAGVRVDTLCRANFVPLRFTVAGNATPADGGTVSAASPNPAAACTGASCTVDFGSRVTLTAAPAPGFNFSGWTGCAGGNAPTVNLDDVRSDIACQATFSRVILTATAAPVPSQGGTVTLASSTPGATCGATCSIPYGGMLIASAAPSAGYRFLGWSGCSAVTTPTLSLSGITSNVSCEARFERVRVTITGVATPQEGGTIDVRTQAQGAECAPGRCSVDFGSAVTLTATAGPGFQFRGWTGCRTASATSITLTNLMDSATCTANFARFRYPVRGAPMGAGTVVATSTSPTAECTGASCVVEDGSAVTLTPMPAPGNRFARWEGCPVTGLGPITIAPVTGAILCTAWFEPVTFVVQGAAMPAGGGLIVGEGANCLGAACTVAQGGTVSLLAMPATPAYGFAGWTGAGCIPDALNPLRVRVANVTAPVTCTASFALQSYPVGGVVVGGGSITATPGMGATCTAAACTVAHGGSVIFSATSPGPGAELVGWTGLGCVQDLADPLRALVTNVMGPTTCTVTFRPRTVTVTGNATGGSIVGGAGCTGATCSVAYGSDVTFVATPSPGFEATPTWAPATCVPELDATRATVRNVTTTTTCTATFKALPLPTPVTISATPASALGTATVSAAGCVAQPSCMVLPGTTVTVTATPIGTATFAGWTGGPGCPATNAGTLVAQASVTCTATFNAAPLPDAGVPSGAASLRVPLDLPLFGAPSADAAVASR